MASEHVRSFSSTTFENFLAGEASIKTLSWLCCPVSGLRCLVANDLLFFHGGQEKIKTLAHNELILSLKRSMKKGATYETFPVRRVISPQISPWFQVDSRVWEIRARADLSPEPLQIIHNHRAPFCVIVQHSP